MSIDLMTWRWMKSKQNCKEDLDKRLTAYKSRKRMAERLASGRTTTPRRNLP